MHRINSLLNFQRQPKCIFNIEMLCYGLYTMTGKTSDWTVVCQTGKPQKVTAEEVHCSQSDVSMLKARIMGGKNVVE